jgi:hypothetical protein
MLSIIITIWAATVIIGVLSVAGYELYSTLRPSPKINQTQPVRVQTELKHQEIDLLEDRYADWDQRWNESQRSR